MLSGSEKIDGGGLQGMVRGVPVECSGGRHEMHSSEETDTQSNRFPPSEERELGRK